MSTSAASPKLYCTPMGYTEIRPNVTLAPIDRGALMRNAHRIAARQRAHFPSYRQALAYGLKAAWGQVNVARSIQMIRLQLQPRTEPLTAREIASSRRATRRCGSSFMYS